MHPPDRISLADLADRIRLTTPRAGATRVVAIDGPSGSGKSTAASRLADALGGAPVVRLDAMYPGWDGLDAVVPLLVEWVLRALADDRQARYRLYDWERGEYAEWHDVPPTGVLVVEGVGSGARAATPYLSTVVWMDAPEKIRYDRGIERDGDAYRPHWQRWAEQEARHFAAEGTAARADLTVDGAVTDLRTGDDELVLCSPREIETLASTVVYRNRWVSVREDRIRRADGKEGLYSVIDKPDFSLVVPESGGGFHLVTQYRYPVQGRFWEFPQGTWDERPDVDPVQLARAELGEETGLRAGTMRHLGRTFAMSGLSSQGCNVFLATDLSRGERALEPEEVGLESRWFSEAEVWAMVDAGRIRDAQTIAALALLHRHRTR